VKSRNASSAKPKFHRVKQRIVLVDAIWESITADRKKTPLSDEEIEDAQQRIISAQKNPSYI